MYNKLFTKILDSSIWLETTPTRIIWMTLLAAMDQDGFAQFASLRNLAHRALISDEDATVAIARLESPDPDSSDPDNEGRRVERVAGGWMVLNSGKYRDIVTAEIGRQRTRERVRKHRLNVTIGNAPVTDANDPVTPSETRYSSKSIINKKAAGAVAHVELPVSLDTDEFRKEWEAFGASRRAGGHRLTARASELILAKLDQRPSEAVAGIQLAVERSWRGFEWAWFDDEKARKSGARSINGRPVAPVTPRKIDEEYDKCMRERNSVRK